MGFRHVAITGGEPLAHPQRDALLDALATLRREVKPAVTVLRTSLALPPGGDLLRRVACSTDGVVVSVDGDQMTHDARRGVGSYDRTVGNLRALVQMGLEADLSLATVLPLGQATGAPGNAVRDLAKELGLRARSGTSALWSRLSQPCGTSHLKCARLLLKHWWRRTAAALLGPSKLIHRQANHWLAQCLTT